MSTDSNRLQRAQVYQEIHKACLETRDATRQIEWLINGALWAGIVVAAGHVAGHVDLAWLGWWHILTAGVVGGCLHFVLWQYWIESSELKDLELARLNLELAYVALEGRGLPKVERDKLAAVRRSVLERTDPALRSGRLKRFKWAILECLTTTVLMVAALCFLSRVPWTGEDCTDVGAVLQSGGAASPP